MDRNEWPAQDYAMGSYIQATIAGQYLDAFHPKIQAKILDIGCGDGAFSTKIAAKVPKGSVLGIDRSHNMIELAQEKTYAFPQFTVQQDDVLEMHFNEEFDYIVSFWCLQWCDDLEKGFRNIYNALKKEGRVLLIIPMGNDVFIECYEAVKAGGQFPILEHFVPKVDLERLCEVPKLFFKQPFKKATIEKETHLIPLESLDIFRKFVRGISFFQGQVPDGMITQINEAIVQHYHELCQEKYQGHYIFNMTPYVISAEK